MRSGRANALRATPPARPCSTPRRRDGPSRPRGCRRPTRAAGHRRSGRRERRRVPPRRSRRSGRSRASPRAAPRLASGAAANARTLSKPWSACSAGTSGLRATSGASVVSTTASSSPSPSGSSKPSLPALRRVEIPSPRSRPSQKSSASSAADPERDRVHHSVAGAAAAGARILEEGDVRAGTAVLVRVEEVVDRRVVLVDRLLHHPQAEHAGVEVDVPRCVAGDAGHVVDAFEPHVSRSSPVSPVSCSGRNSRDQGYLLRQGILLHTQVTHVNAARLDPVELAAWRGLLRAHAALVRELDADLRAAHDLSRTSTRCSSSSRNAPEQRLRMSDLAASVVLSQSGLTRLVDRLVRAGSVERTRCESDRRGLNAELTAPGRRTLERGAADASGGCARACSSTASTTERAAPARRASGSASFPAQLPTEVTTAPVL